MEAINNLGHTLPGVCPSGFCYTFADSIFEQFQPACNIIAAYLFCSIGILAKWKARVASVFDKSGAPETHCLCFVMLPVAPHPIQVNNASLLLRSFLNVWQPKHALENTSGQGGLYTFVLWANVKLPLSKFDVSGALQGARPMLFFDHSGYF